MTNNERIAEAVAQAVADGTLRKGMPLNPPGADYSSGDVYVGRNSYGERVWLSVTLHHRAPTEYFPTLLPAQTVDHESVGERWELSMSGGAVARGRKSPFTGGDWTSCGQIREEFRRVMGVRGVKAVADIWKAHHMNGMRAGCAHVPQPVMERPGPGTYERPDLANTPPCPVTGYRWGNAGLYSELPADAVVTVLSFLGACKTATS